MQKDSSAKMKSAMKNTKGKDKADSSQTDESFCSLFKAKYTDQDQQKQNIDKRRLLMPIKSEQKLQMEDIKINSDIQSNLALPLSPSTDSFRGKSTNYRSEPSHQQLIVITEESLDDWLAQSINLDIKNMPALRKLNLPQQTKDILQKYEPKRKAQYSQIPSVVKSYIDQNNYSQQAINQNNHQFSKFTQSVQQSHQQSRMTTERTDFTPSLRLAMDDKNIVSYRSQNSQVQVVDQLQMAQISSRWSNPSMITPRGFMFTPEQLNSQHLVSVVDQIEQQKALTHKINKRVVQTMKRQAITENAQIRSKSQINSNNDHSPTRVKTSSSPLIKFRNNSRQRNLAALHNYQTYQDDVSFRKLKVFDHKQHQDFNFKSISELNDAQKQERYIAKIKHDNYKVPQLGKNQEMYYTQDRRTSLINPYTSSHKSSSLIIKNPSVIKKNSQYQTKLSRIIQMQSKTETDRIKALKEQISFQSYAQNRQSVQEEIHLVSNQNEISQSYMKDELPLINRAIDIIPQINPYQNAASNQLSRNTSDKSKMMNSATQSPMRSNLQGYYKNAIGLVKKDSTLSARHLSFNQSNILQTQREGSTKSQKRIEKPVSVFRDSNFWLHKAFNFQKDGKFNSSIDSLNKAIALDFTNMQAHLNLAGMLYQIKKYDQSTRVYDNIIAQHEALNDDESFESALYGKVLCQVRLENYERAIDEYESLEKAFPRYTDLDCIRANKPQYLYIKAVILRKLQRFEEASRYYDYLRQEEFSFSSNQQSIDSESISDPYKLLNRRCLEFLRTKIPEYEPPQTLGSIITSRFILDDGWLFDKIEDTAKLLSKLSFFCRFNREQIVHFMKKLKIQTYQADDIVYLEDDLVRIVIDGQLQMISYKASVSEPQVIANLYPGDIINYSRIDQGQSVYFQNWIVANKSFKTTSVIVCDRQFFDFIWDQQNTNNNKIIYETLKNHQALQGVTTQTLYLIAFELIQIRNYKPSETVLKQAHKSKLKKFDKYFYGNRMTNQMIERNKQQFIDKIKLKKKQKVFNPDQSYAAQDKLFQVNKFPVSQLDATANTNPQSIHQESRISLNAFKKTESLIDQLTNQNPIVRDLISRRNSKEQLSVDTNLQIETNKEMYQQKLQLKSEKDKIQYLIESVFKRNMEILNHYLETFKIDDAEDGLYILDEGQCIVKPTIDKTDKSDIQKPKCCHWKNHIKGKDQSEANQEEGQVNQKKCCEQTNKNEQKILKKGDFFGLSDFFRIKTYNYYGDVIASEGSGVSCLYIKKQHLDQRIPYYDLEKIKKNCTEKKNMAEASLAYSLKFSKLANDFISQFYSEN
ncbi:tpr repeat-containing protein [Stylonychia lemnae]|uniref:Tpr repeat-containing protein n=1 Tax=Stylonychia lemnae TaxID=5949 RepID=A0A078A8D2_STYLE|nr:tpr repeat-containing protein [Stylonychia lemnae]|eukprot:CDW77036.1 tpr repeat-containing protein [Stylonychia lemnae]